MIVSQFEVLCEVGDHVAGERIVSPFGAWLVLAANGKLDDIQRLIAEDMLADIPDGVLAAVGAWGFVGNGPFASQVERGPIPDKAGLDDWADRNTAGMITEFPTEPPTGPIADLYASAIAARTSWPEPLTIVDKKWIPGEFWGGQYGGLAVRDSLDHKVRVLKDYGTGPFVDVITTGTNGVAIHSVFGPTTWDATRSLRVARNLASGMRYPEADWREAADMIAGVTVEPIRGLQNIAQAYLPAWEANAFFDLSSVPVFREVVMDALQVAVARFDSVGFEAAAITAMRAGCAPPQGEALRLTATFGRPYAYAAAFAGQGLWRNIPLFEGWVTEVKEPSPTW